MDYTLVKLPQDWVALFIQDAERLAQSLEDYASAVMVEADLDGIPNEVGVASETARAIRKAIDRAMGAPIAGD